ncbi:MAG: GYD domain-containing protein, partial [bacterium]
YDFVNIVEAPDLAAVMKASILLGARGSVRIETLAAVPMDEFVRVVR